MENPNTGVGGGQDGRRRSGLLWISLTANVVLAVVVAGLAIWGWELDQKVTAAIEERDEAWQNSRDLQGRLINVKGLMNDMSDPFQQQQPQRPRSPDDDFGAPP